MSEYQHFEEEEEALFENDDPSIQPQSKGLRLVSAILMSDFIVWLNDFHPEIRGTYDLNRQNILIFVREFERSNGFHSDYTASEWLNNLQRL